MRRGNKRGWKSKVPSRVPTTENFCMGKPEPGKCQEQKRGNLLREARRPGFEFHWRSEFLYLLARLINPVSSSSEYLKINRGPASQSQREYHLDNPAKPPHHKRTDSRPWWLIRNKNRAACECLQRNPPKRIAFPYRQSSTHIA